MNTSRIVALLLLLIHGGDPRLLAQTDSLKDTSAARADTVHVLPERTTIELPSDEERMSVLGVGMIMLGGFVVLLILKRRAADREAGIL